MSENNVHHTEPNSRKDLEHTDTIAIDSAVGADPAGYEQSINPLGEVPPSADGGAVAAEDAPISNRVGQDPSNLGDDVPSEGDLVHPAPVNEPLGRMPGM